MHRPMNDYTAHKIDIYIKTTNTHICTYTQHKYIKQNYEMNKYMNRKKYINNINRIIKRKKK